MALTFPSNPPSLGQDVGYTYNAPNGYTYTWDGAKWYVSSSGQTSGGSGPFTVKDEGNVVNTATTILNFVGNAITATSTGSQVNITVSAQELTTATTSTLGGVKIGSGINITSSGTISVREGLQYWTEDLTVVDSSQTAIVSLLVSGTQTNIDAVIKAQGLGAITNDNTGNKRGEYAVDWQKIRTSNADVASGNFAVISGGSFNKASGLHSIVIGGNNNVADSDYGVILGGVNGNTKGIKGAVIMPGYATGGDNASNGKIQTGYYVLGGDTVQTTSPQTLTTDGSGNVTATNQLTLIDNSLVNFEATVIAKELYATTSSEVVVWSVKGTAVRNNGNTTTNFLSSPIPAIIDGNTATSWQFSMDIDGSLGCILFQVQGPGDKSIRWVAKVETVEITDLGM